MGRHRVNQAPGRRRVSVVFSLLTAGILPSCSSIVLSPQGPVGAAENIILYNSLAIMLAIVVPTIIAVLAFAWWFRASNKRAKYRPDFAYSGRIELVTWGTPLLVILLLGGVIWTGSHDLDPAVPLKSRAKPLEVQVVSLDWKWLFIYPEQGVASINQLVVPAGAPVHFSITSGSVLNAFFIPQLGSMVYAMNGMTTQLNLAANHPGNFYGLSSDFSGDGFAGMHFIAHAVSPVQFATWIAAVRKSGPVLDGASYRVLSRQSMNLPPSTYSAAAPGLFNEIVMQKLAPGPGPQSAHKDVSPRSGGNHVG